MNIPAIGVGEYSYYLFKANKHEKNKQRKQTPLLS
jgi:hypothetical protein